MNRFLLNLVIFPALLASGCASYITVQSERPGPVNVGATKTLVMLDGAGRRSATEFVAQEFQSTARTAGYFRIVDKSESGVTLALAGGTATVENATEALEAGAAYLKIDVLDWTADKTTNSNTDKEGKTTTVTTNTGTVVLAVTLAGADGHAVLAEKDYEDTWSSSSKDVSKDDVIENAGRAAINQILSDITPVNVAARVRIDTSDKAQKPFIATAKEGNFSQAVDDLRAYIHENANNGAAYYNMALFIDAMGNYSEAMGAYDRAIELSGGSKSFYTAARAACARRQADLEALSN